MSTTHNTDRVPGRGTPVATGLADFTVRIATPQDWRPVVEWANAEGWNVGHQDPACFLATDPEGFYIGYLNDRPIAAVSLVNHSADYGVWGHYLVHPAFRRKGYGRMVCKVARPHGGRRVLASDAMPQQVANYQRSGLVPAHDTVNYVGRPRPGHAEVGAEGVDRIGPEHLEAIAGYDAESFPAYRRVFLDQWLRAAGHVGYARYRDGRVTGYGVIRPAPLGHRIGPFVADTPADADVLFAALTARLGPEEQVSVFAPDQHGTAGFFTSRGLSEQFRVVRMYKGQPPRVKEERVLAIACLELG